MKKALELNYKSIRKSFGDNSFMRSYDVFGSAGFYWICHGVTIYQEDLLPKKIFKTIKKVFVEKVRSAVYREEK